MRLLLSLSIALLAAVGLTSVAPARAHAETTPCGFLNGQFDLAGRTLVGEARYGGQTFQIAASFNRDCTITFSEVGKNPRSGTWLQKNENVGIRLGDADFLGKVAADGSISGQMATHDDKPGTFSFSAPKGSAQPAPRKPTAGGSGAGCGKGDAEHPYVAGQSYHGTLSWKGDEPEALTLTFNADCSVEYIYDDGSVGSARWRQNGMELDLDVNGGYASYSGYVQQGGYSGTLKNISGKTGFFRFIQK